MFAARGGDLVAAEERRLGVAGLFSAVARFGAVEQLPECFERPIQDGQDEMHVLPASARAGSEQRESPLINSSNDGEIKHSKFDKAGRIGA